MSESVALIMEKARLQVDVHLKFVLQRAAREVTLVTPRI